MKTSKLIGPALDWAVAKSEGINPTFNMKSHGRTWHGWWVANPIYRRMPHYSTDWSKGGPIIEREGILLRPVRKEGHKLNGQWLAMYDGGNTGSMVQWTDKFWFPRHYLTGPTPLIAAMRCYVASKLGDEADIPKELLGELK